MHPINHKLLTITQNYQSSNYSPITLRLLLKEYLQNIVLYVIYNDPKWKELIFYGGTCLRKLYKLNRMSEDLDFESLTPVNLTLLEKKLLTFFSQNKLDNVDTHVHQSGAVRRLTLKFSVLHQLGLSAHESEKLNLKIEINDRQKHIYTTQLTPFMSQEYSMLIKHYDLPTLMAGKMSACLNRTFQKGKTGIEIKGRDYYDLVWYMSQNILPNLNLLQDSLSKTSIDAVFTRLDEKIEKISTRDLLIDLEPLFLEKQFIRDWCKNFKNIYETYRSKSNTSHAST